MWPPKNLLVLKSLALAGSNCNLKTLVVHYSKESLPEQTALARRISSLGPRSYNYWLGRRAVAITLQNSQIGPPGSDRLPVLMGENAGELMHMGEVVGHPGC